MFQIGGEQIALVTDTACDLPEEIIQQYDIRLISLRIATSTGEYRDRTEISQDALYEVLQREIPKTSLPLPEDIRSVYDQLAQEGCTRVLHLCMSGNLSGTYNLTRMLAEEYQGLQIDVVDTLTLSCGLGLLVVDAVECLTKGMPVEDVITRVLTLRKGQLGTFVIRTLEFLRKGGRIGLVEGVVGSLLQLKPVIFVNDDGIYQTLLKGRGVKKAVDGMCAEFERRYQGRRVRMAVVHGQAPEEAKALLERFRQSMDVAYSLIAPVSPALAIHTGPGLLGVIMQDA